MDGRFYNHALLREQDHKLRPNVAQLCRDLKISRTHYYSVINGVSASPEMLELLCPQLGLTYADVILAEPAPAT